LQDYGIITSSGTLGREHADPVYQTGPGVLQHPIDIQWESCFLGKTEIAILSPFDPQCGHYSAKDAK